MTLEEVWEMLEEGKWESENTLGEASGSDEDALFRIIRFLDRWNFVDTRRTPELQVRRRTGAISPIETFQLLRSVITEPAVADRRHVLAERVACRSCGGRQLNIIGGNKVECAECNETQWYQVEASDLLGVAPLTETHPPTELSKVGRLLVRLGHPQKAFSAFIPKATQYFWFRCTSCGKTSTDYAHGHSKYLTCPQCKTRNQFW